MLIYEFRTKKEAQRCLDAIHAMARDYWASKGYTVDKGGVVGKCYGKDNPRAQETAVWDTIRKSPKNTFYFSSLKNKNNFKNGTQLLLDAGFKFKERKMPVEWKKKTI